MKKLLHCLVSIFLAFGIVIQAAQAGLAPENVLVVVNGASEASVAVAKEYVRLRDIPVGNVFTLEKVTNVEQMSVDAFRTEILGPVLEAIETRKLSRQIECVVYSADIPSAIQVGSDIGKQSLPQIFTPVASINGLTFLHQLTMAKDIRYLDLNANFYARRILARSTDTTWNPGDVQAYARAMQQLQERSTRGGLRAERGPADALRPENDRRFQEAIATLFELKQRHPNSSDLLYNLACVLATSDQPTKAIETLSEAVRAGWWDHRHVVRDPDLASLRDLTEYKAVLSEMKSVGFEMKPSRGFRANVGWFPNGDPTEPGRGPKYLLSTVLSVTAGRGVSVEESLENIRLSKQADGTRPKGTIYFLRNGDVRSTTREWAFEASAKKLNSLGIATSIEDGVLPQQKSDVAGAVIGIADFDWAKSGSKILPGAIVEHLTSFGGVMSKGAGQTPLTEFLRNGAAGASGTVTEPYAIQAKFPNPFIHVHYASGCCLAEAFYQSVTGPYQLLIVGDPLCSPWRKDANVSVDGLGDENVIAGEVILRPKVESKDGLQPREFSLYVDGQLVETIRAEQTFQFDATRLANGPHQLTVLVRCDDMVETVGRWTMPVTVRNDQ